MRKLLFLIGIIAITVSCTAIQQTEIRIHMEGGEIGSQLRLGSKDSLYTSMIDSTGSVCYILPETFQNGYATISYKNYTLPVYIEKGKDLNIEFSLDGHIQKPVFKGETAAINEYLNSDTLKSVRIFFEWDEEPFIASLFKTEEDLIGNLESMNFNHDFVNLEKKRIHYMIFTYLGIYPSYHHRYAESDSYRPSEKLYKTLESVLKEEDDVSYLSEYKWAWNYAIEVFGEKGMIEYRPDKYTRNQLDFILEKIKNPVTIENNVHAVVINYINNYGLDNADEFIRIYKEKVTSPKKLELFENACSKWERLKPGHKAPDFQLSDINGKTVTLQDLSGKYVFMDVWATWCSPCRQELPHMQKLEKIFKGKNISFVSISCDKETKAWEQTVKNQKLGGIQLHIGKGSSFGDDYVIQGIPRFILLDKEGKIINAEMTRPSDPKTEETLRSLEGI